MDAQALEDLLAEIGRRILAGEDPTHLMGLAGEPPALSEDGVRVALDAGACRIGVRSCPAPQLNGLAGYFDHTLLRPDATFADVDRLCAEAMDNRFASVCVNGMFVRRCAEILAGSGVLVCAVVGFPLGAMASDLKVAEARRAIADGACEIDTVIPVGALKSGADRYVLDELTALARACHELGARLKVILECALLDEPQKVRGCELARDAGADFVKTSTGFAKGGATVADVALMRRVVGPRMGIKAAGGVRDLASAQAMIAAGATRIGASASVEIVAGGTVAGTY